MNRRHFIKSASVFFAAFFFSSLSAYAEGRRMSCSADLHLLIGDLSLAKKSGRAYRARYPEEDNFEFLYRDVFAGRITRNQVTVMKKRDFQEENLITLDGWYVTRTEARLMALASLV